MVGLAALFAAQSLHHAGYLDGFDNRMEAWRSGLSPRDATGAVAIAALDARSLDMVGQWPWGRDLHARAIDNLVAAGAEAIAFDIDFSSPSLPAADAALADAIERADGRVTLPIFKRRWSSDLAIPDFTTVSKPLTALRENAWLAAVNVRPDNDGILRTLPRNADFGDASDVPSLSAALAEAAPGPPLRVDFSIAPHSVPVIAYVDVVRNTFDPERVRGRRVVIGATATELRDDVSVPRYGNLPGVVVHALGAETLMQDRALRSQPVWRVAVLLVVMVCAFAVAGHNAFKLYAFAAFLVGSVLAIEALAAFAFVEHAMSVSTAQFHVQALLSAVGVVATNLESARAQLFFARREVADGDAILGRVIDDNPSGILVVTRAGDVLRMNGSAQALLGEERTLNALPHIHPALATRLREAMAHTDRTTDGLVELGQAANDRILEFNVAPTVLSEDRTRQARYVFCITLNDVTQRERAHALARYQAEHDALTDLYSRYAAVRRLEALESESGSAVAKAVIVLDLDRFGTVNEAHGFEGADHLLCEVAKRLLDWGPERFIARLGSDEFLIVVELAERAALEGVLGGLRELLGRPITLAHATVTCSATLGVALAGGDAADLLKRANAALRKAKSQALPWFVHDDDLAQATRRHSLIDAALPVAIAGEEFSLVYQPQLDLRTNTIKGAEALVRWTHPALGFVSPADFIPIAELTGQIVALGRWVMNEACRQAAAWPGEASVAVNVSARQMNEELLPTVRAALAESGLAAHRLEIELTEGLMVDFARIRPILVGLRELGVGLAVDDFGTGYSSLSHLREAPFTKIKLDRAFVSGLGRDYRADMLFGAMSTLIADLDMDALVEGVETEAELRVVRATPCHAVQGYYVAKPLPPREFLSFVSEWNEGAARARA